MSAVLIALATAAKWDRRGKVETGTIDLGVR
jgi:hypothetical protein